MFITKYLGCKIDSDSKHIPIRTFDYEATKIERNMIMKKKYFENLEYREVSGVLIPDIELPEEAIIASSFCVGYSSTPSRTFTLKVCRISKLEVPMETI